MITIKFSHRYKKMPLFFVGSKLLSASPLHYKDLSEEYIKQDTETIEGKFYKLPRTMLIELRFDTKGHLWGTLRRYTPRKLTYYQAHIGEEVEIQIYEK